MTTVFVDEWLFFIGIWTSDDVASSLVVDFIVFLCLFSLVFSPPIAFVKCGIIIENLPKPGRRCDSLLTNLEMKIYMNRLYLATPPVIFGIPLNSILVCYGLAFFVFIYQLVNAIIGYYNLALRKTRLLGGFSKEEIYNFSYSYSRFLFPASLASAPVLNKSIFIYKRRFGYTVERMADLKFAVINSVRKGSCEVLTIFIENCVTGACYKLRICSVKLPALRYFVVVDMKYIYERFLERFTGYINDNPQFVMRDTDSLGPCLACCAKKPNVVIKKNCTDGPCSSCDCRPTWCVECLARIFTAAQPADRLATWMDGRAYCPTCRATFCANDVFFVIDETDL